MTALSEPRRFVEAFDLIRRYAELRGWIPIGWRQFQIGEWTITVNGTREPRGNVPAYHALVENTRYVGFMLMHPCGGSVAGFQGTEAEFCDAMKQALAEEKKGGAMIQPECWHCHHTAPFQSREHAIDAGWSRFHKGDAVEFWLCPHHADHGARLIEQEGLADVTREGRIREQ